MLLINKIIEKLKKPSKAIITLSFVITVAFSSLSLVFVGLGFSSTSFLEICAYISFALAAVSLAYSVYIITVYGKGIVNFIADGIKKNSFANRLITNFDFRTLVTSLVNFIMGVAYSLFNAVLGIVYSSIWYGALAAYYIILTLTRGGMLNFHHKNVRREDFVDKSLKSYRGCAYLLLLLNIALSSAIAQMIFDDRAFTYPGWIVIGYAAYAFYKITMAIINVVRARKSEAYTVKAIRNINLVDGVVSILALQTALLYAYSSGNISENSLANTLTGSAVSVIAVGISLYMLVTSSRRLKGKKQENE